MLNNVFKKQQQVAIMLEEKTNTLNNTFTPLRENITNAHRKQLARIKQLREQQMKQQNFINLLLSNLSSVNGN